MTLRADETRASAGPSLAVVGGGLAGMAAAWFAAEKGFRVELFERAKTLGGRAGSFTDPKTGEAVDFCQHAAMGCCREFLDFCRRTGIADHFQRVRTLHFIGPDGRRRDFSPAGFLPTPLHMLPGLMKLDYLAPGERWKIVRALVRMMRSRDDEPAAGWLSRHGQSPRAIERFWSTILVGALAETVEHASLAAARKVFRDGFLGSRGASDLLLPRRPLVEIFHGLLIDCLMSRGIKIHLNSPVRLIEVDRHSARSLVLNGGERRLFDFFIAAVPWFKARALFGDSLLSAMPSLAGVDQIHPASITAVHFWFDQPVVPIPHAVLVGRLGQWVFAPEPADPTAAQHCQVVISASHRLARRSREELSETVLAELRSIWPAVGAATLVHRRVAVWPAAVFSCLPGTETLRPEQKTPVSNLALAGDWTNTGWPGTMESAIRSGRRAVETISGAG